MRMLNSSRGSAMRPLHCTPCWLRLWVKILEHGVCVGRSAEALWIRVHQWRHYRTPQRDRCRINSSGRRYLEFSACSSDVLVRSTGTDPAANSIRHMHWPNNRHAIRWNQVAMICDQWSCGQWCCLVGARAGPVRHTHLHAASSQKSKVILYYANDKRTCLQQWWYIHIHTRNICHAGQEQQVLVR